MIPVKIDSVTVHVKKDKSGTYNKLNNQIFIWDPEQAEQLKGLVGRTFMMDIDESSSFHKLKEIGMETDNKIEVINCTGQPKVPQQYDVTNNKIVNELAKEFILKQDKPNSRTYGKGADSIKIYFSTAESLREQIEALESKGLMPYDYTVDRAKAEEILAEQPEPKNEQPVDFTITTPVKDASR